MSSKPEVFGKYILLEKIATGGMAEIYLARATGAENVSKFFAIKRILPQFSQNYEFVQMFKEEAKIAIQLSHANIVPIFEFGEENGQFYLAMEFVEGRNLRQVLTYAKKREESLDIPMCAYIIKEAARGLSNAHNSVDGTTGAPLNITHRDISPQNIMLSFEGEVKIVDFGIAKAESKIESTRAGTLKGKFGYMSPEQAEGQDVDFRTDIFSLGIVLWELLAKDRLFVSNNEMNTLKKIRDCQIPSLRKIDSNIPAELERITNKALTRDRTLRYQSSEEMYLDLNVFLNKHYPEFSAQGLSRVLKLIFQTEREENRKKFIEYAKIKIEPSQKQKMDLTLENTNTQTEPSLTASKTANIHESNENTNTFANKMAKHRPPEKLNLDFDRDDLIVKSTKQRVKLKTRSQSRHNTGVKYSTAYPQGTGTYTNSDMNFKPEPPSRILTLLVLIGFCFVGYKFYNSQYYEPLRKDFFATLGIKDPAENRSEHHLQQASQVPYYTFLVISDPPDATILLNDANTGVITPGQIRVPANTDFKIQLKKEGFARAEQTRRVMKPGEEIKIKLAPVQLGYIAVQIKESVSAVFVNNVRVNSMDLLKKYPVEAGTPVRVIAYSTDQKTFGEATIQVPANSVTPVVLKLEKKNTQDNIRK